MFKYTYGNKYCENEEISKRDVTDSDILCVCLDFLQMEELNYDILPEDWDDTIFYKKKEV